MTLKKKKINKELFISERSIKIVLVENTCFSLIV